MALIFSKDSAHPEIGQFHHRTTTDVDGKENVARIQVAVNDAIGVQESQSHDDLTNDWCPIIPDGRTVVPPLDEVVQRPIAQFSHQKTK